MLTFRSAAFYLSLAILIAGTSCDHSTPTDSPAPKTEWIDPNKIQLSPTMHESLSDDLVARIKTIHATFADVDGTPLDKWIDDFKRDLDPESNVKIWEDMQIAYTKYCDGRDLPLKTRKEVFKVVLFRSMSSPSDVLERIELVILTKEDATEIMKGYLAAPKPIDVIRTEK